MYQMSEGLSSTETRSSVLTGGRRLFTFWRQDLMRAKAADERSGRQMWESKQQINDTQRKAGNKFGCKAV